MFTKPTSDPQNQLQPGGPFTRSDDARSAKAEAKAAKARAKALRPWYKKKRHYILAATALIIVGSIAGGSGSDDNTASSNNGGVKTLSNNGDHPPQDDVSITECTTDALGLGNAKLAVTNHSSKQSDYIITVSFEDTSATQMGTGNALVQNVDAGQNANDSAIGSIEGDASGMTCKVKSVDRMASF
jgi:hypothetical protein